MEKLSQGVPSTSSSVRQMRTPGNGCRSHHTSKQRRQLLGWSVSTHVRQLSQPQECAGTTWYSNVNWTYGEDWDELTYITYDFELGKGDEENTY